MVVSLLLLEQSGRLREGHADVELVDRDDDAESSECVPVRNEGGRRGDFTDDEMSLNTDTIDRDVLGLERLYEVLHGGGLRAYASNKHQENPQVFSTRLTSRLNVVVVDEELGGGVSRTRGLERDVDVGGAKGVLEHKRTVCTIIVERLCRAFE